jgi:hypothetical protein
MWKVFGDMRAEKTDEYRKLHKEKLNIFLLHLIKLGRLIKKEKNVMGRGWGWHGAHSRLGRSE